MFHPLQDPWSELEELGFNPEYLKRLKERAVTSIELTKNIEMLADYYEQFKEVGFTDRDLARIVSLVSFTADNRLANIGSRMMITLVCGGLNLVKAPLHFKPHKLTNMMLSLNGLEKLRTLVEMSKESGFTPFKNQAEFKASFEKRCKKFPMLRVLWCYSDANESYMEYRKQDAIYKDWLSEEELHQLNRLSRISKTRDLHYWKRDTVRPVLLGDNYYSREDFGQTREEFEKAQDNPDAVESWCDSWANPFDQNPAPALTQSQEKSNQRNVSKIPFFIVYENNGKSGVVDEQQSSINAFSN
ncbi:TPA: hypothetical protein ACF754_001963 [Legionella pneumophila]|uniref:hypothetical protein n=1 Tax=Legionella pneumophila TaxID=446 RepID=UPI000E066B73|nr:hypothetical protein [Legionella pneumophila]HAT9524295.1 hypothetical protein [Legionella pneumophila subsp. pneumophila]STY14897.1 Uncharacterised protein [Legionella pneumophila]HAT1976831.1 hypothetical protein [Legionella pneumophila]HAU2156814.1 hypothetical protein [Legionella pneumophila]HDV6746961.1 hypothetical protein [Legionella pneumophila]